jgi:hypothetical protein
MRAIRRKKNQLSIKPLRRKSLSFKLQQFYLFFE